MRHQRKKIWIDRLQTYLSIRLGLYFVLYQVAVWSLIGLLRYILEVSGAVLGPTLARSFFFFCASAIVFLGFLFIYDAVCFIHRIVGPLHRFRKAIQAITAGEEVDLVGLRAGDYLQEMKDDLNQMLKVLEQRGAVTLKATNTKQDQDKLVSV
jgi:hypothetical protein